MFHERGINLIFFILRFYTLYLQFHMMCINWRKHNATQFLIFSIKCPITYHICLPRQLVCKFFGIFYRKIRAIFFRPR